MGMNASTFLVPPTRFSRRRLLIGAASFGATAALVAACSSDPSEIIKPPKTDGDASLKSLTLNTGGGFTPWQYAATNIPQLSIGDGRAIYAGPEVAIFPGPALPNVLTRTIDATGLANIAKVLTDAGLVGAPIDFGLPGVTDMPSTRLVFVIGTKTYEHDAYALDFTDADQGLTAAKKASRIKLRGAVAAITVLDKVAAGHVGDEAPYEATGYELWGTVFDPASVGDGPAQPIIDWPHLTIDLTPIPQGGPLCIAADASVKATFANANKMSVFRQGKLLVQIAPRPVLPGETACKRN
jgi:hypothetical protein